MTTEHVTNPRVVLELELQSARTAYKAHSSTQNKLWFDNARDALDNYINLEALAPEVEDTK